ncbi:MAG: hypothetical protein V3S33_08475 [Gammaproteobacteria bacterium]
MAIKYVVPVLVFAALTVVANSAQAIPAFARKYQTDCSSCHTAFPQLNKAGRKFKEAGYRFPKLKGEETISDFLHWGQHFPISALVKSRPYDKKSNGDEKLRAIHEVEILIGGVLYKNVSGFMELEAEDEDTNERGFEIGVAHGWLTYSFDQAANVQASWGPLLATDPYDTYSRRLTRGTPSVLDRKFGGADNDGKLSSPRQSISIYGRPIPEHSQLYYSAGVAGVAGDSEGVNPKTVWGRLAYDVTKDVMIGLLAIDGECEEGADDCAVDRDYKRYGIDAQADIADFRVMGVWLTAEDDNAAGTDQEDNDAWYIQAQYVMKRDGRPTWAPIIRLDQWEEDDGSSEFSAVTLNLSYYFTQNIKGFIEYFDLYDADNSDDENSRFTLQIEAAF